LEDEALALESNPDVLVFLWSSQRWQLPRAKETAEVLEICGDALKKKKSCRHTHSCACWSFAFFPCLCCHLNKKQPFHGDSASRRSVF